MIRLINIKDKVFQSVTVAIDKDIKICIESMEKSGLKTAVITDLDGKLCGLVSDGDVRRALYGGLSINTSVTEIMSLNPIVITGHADRDKALKIMEDNKVTFIPSLDDNGILKGVWLSSFFEELPVLENSFVIMAGGKGSRLGKLTSENPKPLLDVGGMSIIERIIRSAKQSGFRNFIITVNYLAHKIVENLGDGSRLGVNIEYVKEDKPLGTAGSLSLISPRPTSDFIVVNGDIISDICYRELLEYHLNLSSNATITVRSHVIQNPYGVLHIVNGELLSCEEKPKYLSDINAGMYVLNPKVLDELQLDAYCDMPTLLLDMVDRGGRVTVYRLEAPWLDVGKPDDLSDARRIENII